MRRGIAFVSKQLTKWLRCRAKKIPAAKIFPPPGTLPSVFSVLPRFSKGQGAI